MVRFLIRRPVAVFMVGFALLLLGIVAMMRIPTSLMPDIAIPEITVRLSYPNGTAREIETNIVRPLRQRLMQVSALRDIESQTRDGQAILKLFYDYGTDTDLAYIEANEKLDASLNYLPRDLQRPRVIKASATDIPILNLTVSLKGAVNDKSFLKLSEFSEMVLKKRIEQLPDIAIADMSGQSLPEISLRPMPDKMRSLGLTNEALVKALEKNNFEFGNLLVRDGIYQYNFKFSNPLQTVGDIKNIFLNVKDRLVKVKDLAEVSLQAQEERGLVFSNGKRAIVFSIIKQSGARVYDLKEQLAELVSSFTENYPNLAFSVNQDQTKLLKLSIDNLKSSLLIGGVLAVLILFFFLKDIKSPVIIAISIPASLILSIFTMYLFGLSLNVISLSGLILGVGMMVDNSIIVIDNINQKLETGLSLDDACTKGTNEIIAPLFSSVLTTCSVFLPLVFLSGITGALFYGQAMAVSIGLGCSLLVSITLIPVIFRQLKIRHFKFEDRFANRKETKRLETIYHRGLLYFFKRKWMIYACSIAFMVLSFVLFNTMHYSRLPEISHHETLLKVDWNDNISVYENQNRLQSILRKLPGLKTRYSQIGEQDFLLQRASTQSLSEAKVFLGFISPVALKNGKRLLQQKFSVLYPNAKYRFNPPKTIFEYIFGGEEEQLVAKVYSRDKILAPPEEKLPEIRERLKPLQVSEVPLKNTIYIQILHERLLLYEVDYDNLIGELRTAFGKNSVGNLKTAERFIPITLDYNETGLKNILSGLFVQNKKGTLIPAKKLLAIQYAQNYKTITANKGGEYVKLVVQDNKESVADMENVRNSFNMSPGYKVHFGGSSIEFKAMGTELTIVVIVALLLLYFILAAQFESLWQPLVIMLEIPINIGAGLLLIWLFDGTINIMAAIGFVVMSGVVVNDSILKIHTINMLRKEGYELKEAIYLGGTMRVKSIVMTALTTILGMLPILFINGLGAELQRPLALVIIGGMILGTFISLYLIPLIYYDLNRFKLKLLMKRNAKRKS